MKKRILLFRASDDPHGRSEVWYAWWNDPEIRRLFGTDTLPTAFHATVPASEVVKEIKRLNPDAEVEVQE